MRLFVIKLIRQPQSHLLLKRNFFLRANASANRPICFSSSKTELLSTLIEKTSNLELNNNKFYSIEKRFRSTMPPVNQSVKEYVEGLISDNSVVIFSKTTCPFCLKVKALFKGLEQDFTTIELDQLPNGNEIKDYLIEKTNQTTVPNVFIKGNHIGGYDSTTKLHNQGRLSPMFDSPRNGDSSMYTKPKPGQQIDQFVNDLIKTNRVVIFSKSTCPICLKIKDLFKSMNETYISVELDRIEDGPAIRDYLYDRTGQKTVPNVYVKGKHMGGYDTVTKAHNDTRLTKLLNEEKIEDDTQYDYDMIVIGGGSGGLACSKAAAAAGAKVAVLDFVKPSPQGSTWGLGGTCVNVGCIPKKLMHQSAILGESLNDSRDYGWQTPENIQHNWEVMRENIQNYIGSLNFNYRVQLRDKKVEYINAFGEFIDQHKLKLSYKNGKTKEVTARNVVIAVGGRPKYPSDIKGAAEYCISSDDLFSLPYNPGKTLCVGASYVSLECAGFLKDIGNDVSVMVRSILLRGFDQQMAGIIGDYMENHGIKFIRGAVPTEITRIKEGQPGELLVKYKNENGEILEEVYNTVLLAVGREVCTADLNLDKIGVKINPKSKKILTNFEQTSVDNIYAIGDVVDESSANGRVLELTPVAIKAGQLLANRIYGKSDVKMDYYAVPTTVFTPIEYGSIGYSEEEAISTFGEDNIEVYHTNFWPLEWTIAHKPHDVCYAKLICNITDNMRVIGLHVAGPNAGEMTQGYAVAFKLRATKKDFDMTVGIHPTCSETFTTLKVTKRSGESVGGSGC